MGRRSRRGWLFWTAGAAPFCNNGGGDWWRKKRLGKQEVSLFREAMKLLIENVDGMGAEDYTGFVDSGKSPTVVRKLNSPSELKLGLAAREGSLAVPVLGARVALTLNNGKDLFTGYVVHTPT